MSAENNLTARLRRKIVLWQPDEKMEDSYGLVNQWQEAAKLWAEVKVIDNKQDFNFARQNEVSYYQVTVRYNTDIKVGYKITLAKYEMIIISVMPDILTQKTTVLICKQITI